MSVRRIALFLGAAVLAVFATAGDSFAQAFTTLVNFDGPNGQQPAYESLVQGTDGNLYGTTPGVGPNGYGTVFKMTPGGTLTTIYSFGDENGSWPDGDAPSAGLVLGTDGNFYGTTIEGGSSTLCYGGCGTVFKVTSSGVLTTLHSFSSTDGAAPRAALVQGTDGSYYGTTPIGGPNTAYCNVGVGGSCGTIFKITSAGEFTNLHNFEGTDGAGPSALLQASDGNFYGTTEGGGAYEGGTVFRMTPGGAITTLYNFCSRTNCTDGQDPFAGLIQASNGDFYGTTVAGGGMCDYSDGGTVFKITAQGTLTTLVEVCQGPYAPLLRATDGNLYGTTVTGGNGKNSWCTGDFGTGCGTAFKLTPGEVFSLVQTFNYTNGASPLGGLFQATNGILYGTAEFGGTGTVGTVYSLDPGLGAFVAFVQATGRVGGTAQILGQGFTGTSSVTFNGVAVVSVRVVSDTYLTAVVPTGADTGPVVVTTPSGVLYSDVSFRVVE